MSRNPSLGNEKCEFCIRSLLLWATNKMVHNYYKCGIFLFLLILGQIKVKYTLYAYLIFVTGAREEKMCHVETFQISLIDRCWDNWNFSTCRVISKFSPWQMWRNLKSPSLIMNHYQKNMCTIYGVLSHFILFCRKISLFGFTLFCRENVLSQFTRYCVEKILATTCARGEKNDKYQVWFIWSFVSVYSFDGCFRGGRNRIYSR